MKRIYDWITKANQVLLFFVIMGGAGLVAYLVYQSSRTFEPPHVVVAQTAEEAKETYVHDVDFLGEWSGFYVLGMMKRIVTPAREPWGRPSVSYLGKGNDNGQLVNIVFSKGEQRVRTLLEKDGLVLFHNVYSNLHPQPGQERSKALFFRCVTEDTDGDHRLDEHDRNDLYIVAEDLARADIVMKGIADFQAISPTHVAVKTKEGSTIRFWDIDTETQAQKEILWK